MGYFFDLGKLSFLMRGFSEASTDSAYEKFSKDTYNRIYDDTKAALEASDGKPLLVVSGEAHDDTDLDNLVNKILPDSLENPAYASMVAHMAAYQAAVDLVGKDNVVVSTEMSEPLLAELKSDIEKNAEFGRKAFFEAPFHNVTRYAIDAGVKVSADDPLNEREEDPERFIAEINAIKEHALADNPPKIVVHLAGAAHIGTLQGIPWLKLVEEGENLTKADAKDPFEGVYGQKLFYNSLQDTPETFFKRAAGHFEYAKNPANAVQIDPPSAILDAERFFLEKYIERASQERHGQSALSDISKGFNETATSTAEDDAVSPPSIDGIKP